ncbi:hypothetical protein MTR67_002564, partial [Solanum verrucosum]
MKELAKDVRRLAHLVVCLTETSDSGVIVHNGTKSSLVAEVKEKQDIDPILLQLKSTVHQQKVQVQVLRIEIKHRSVPDPYSEASVIMPPCRAYARNANACNANTVHPVPDHEWKENKGWDVTPLTWECFTGAFLDRFFQRGLREAKAQKFMSLKQ